METLNHLQQSGIQFISRDSILRGQGIAKTVEPPIRQLDEEEKKRIVEKSPGVGGLLATWEYGLTPIGRLDTKSDHNVLPQTIYDYEQTIAHSRPGSKPYPISSYLAHVTEDEWMDLSNKKKAQYMTVVDQITGDIIDTTGRMKEEFQSSSATVDTITGVLYDSSLNILSGTVNLTHSSNP